MPFTCGPTFPLFYSLLVTDLEVVFLLYTVVFASFISSCGWAFPQTIPMCWSSIFKLLLCRFSLLPSPDREGNLILQIFSLGFVQAGKLDVNGKQQLLVFLHVQRSFVGEISFITFCVTGEKSILNASVHTIRYACCQMFAFCHHLPWASLDWLVFGQVCL